MGVCRTRLFRLNISDVPLSAVGLCLRVYSRLFAVPIRVHSRFVFALFVPFCGYSWLFICANLQLARHSLARRMVHLRLKLLLGDKPSSNAVILIVAISLLHDKIRLRRDTS
jgi:hypothetical protein